MGVYMFDLYLAKNGKIHAKKRVFLCFSLIFAAFLFSTCDTPMGMGDIVDLEPPILQVICIELPDGTITPIMDENGKIPIGPGIRFGRGATIKGRAMDNIGVVQIQVLETGTGNVWTSSSISKANAEGWQDWSINLNGLQNGERSIEITAYDYASLASSQKNIGQDTVKQLNLLVDTEPPIIEKIYIERQPGIFADLLPRNVFDTLDKDKFEYIDYFQNEKFTIRASINHDFPISKVTLNFLDENGTPIFATPREASGNVFTPYWDITEKDLTDIDTKYSTGKHYLKVLITATAEAGHSNIQNQLYNLCWEPESDYPHIVIDKSGEDTNDTIYRAKDTAFPMNVFDDDKVDEVYYAIVKEDTWTSYKPSGYTTDEQKMEYISKNKDSFPGDTTSGNNPLTTAKSTPSSRNAVIAIKTGSIPDNYRLIVLAKVNKSSGYNMSHKLYKMVVTGELDDSCNLVAIVCDNADGAYPEKSVLNFKMIFSAEMYSVGDLSITIQGGTKSQGGPITIKMSSIPKTSPDFAFTGSWTVPPNIIFDPVVITDIDVSNARRYSSDKKPTVASSITTQYNSNRTGLKVMSVKPTITKINGQNINNDTVLAPSGERSKLTLTFSHAVYPQNGTITIKPASNWLIPPVLTNDDFAKINNALVVPADQTALTDSSKTSYYTKTTHGLKTENRSGTIYYVPDTDTKYVLNFDSNLDNDILRPILDKAKYNWQEIDISGSQISGAGTDTITVDLDQLPDGRLWKVEIVGPKTDDGAFRDEAGNTFAGWGTGSTQTFWSANTAKPVIRVNRVSNNRAISSSTGTLQTGVQYRIDCETPGATIQQGLRNNTDKVSTVPSTTTAGAPYIANSNDGDQNSNIQDATPAELAIISLGAYTANDLLWIDNTNNFYTARKDYIAATAKRNSNPSLDTSNRGYEGAFKTVVVYRSIQDQIAGGSGKFLKIEGSNLRNGAVTISGFPINMNDMSGNSSKFAYRNGDNNTDDWIWISWEIVSEFWQVSPLSISSNQPGALFNNGDNDNSWQPFSANYYQHNYRKYGNWGLQIGNN